ncbi:MAG: triose-phosphate isomerase [Actinomycetota bacterium]|nr:triose-phosphate isomerase [Actinomycetota bacterium]
MNLTHLEGMRLTQALAHELAGHDFTRVEVVLCPPFTALRTLQTLIDSDRYEFGLGAQNLYPRSDGAFTGEISPVMLQALRVAYVIVGHSERRTLMGESDDEVNGKVKAALANNLVPIMCCGETEEERAAHQTEAKVGRQVKAGLAGLKPEQAQRIVVAYEPIWAIGTGATATPADAQETISLIRSELAEQLSEEAAGGIRILYGGSVKAGNAAALTSQPDLDGALVGGASLDAAEFAAIVKATGVKATRS